MSPPLLSICPMSAFPQSPARVCIVEQNSTSIVAKSVFIILIFLSLYKCYLLFNRTMVEKVTGLHVFLCHFFLQHPLLGAFGG